MLFFARDFATTFLAAMLLTSGAWHAYGLAAFRATLESHGLAPTRALTPIAIGVTIAEVATGALLLYAAWSRLAPLTLILFGGGAIAGAAFLVYVRRLLLSATARTHAGSTERPADRARPAASTCGCSPLASPVTPASLVPGASLLIVSIVGLLATGLLAASSASDGDAFRALRLVSPVDGGVDASVDGSVASGASASLLSIAVPTMMTAVLPIVWGLTLAGIVWLFPAAVGLEDA